MQPLRDFLYPKRGGIVAVFSVVLLLNGFAIAFAMGFGRLVIDRVV
jgi:hypothetical protein